MHKVASLHNVAEYDELEALLDLLPPKKIRVKRLAVNVQDSRHFALNLHVPLSDYLVQNKQINVIKDSRGFDVYQPVMDSYRNSNIISVKAPWTASPSRNTANSAFSDSAGDKHYDNYDNNDDRNNKVDNDNNPQPKNELDDYLATLGSDSDTNADTNAYSFSKIAHEKTIAAPPPLAPYWPNAKIKLTTLVWLEKRKKQRPEGLVGRKEGRKEEGKVGRKELKKGT